jgi:FixJ family two-component response regulator
MGVFQQSTKTNLETGSVLNKNNATIFLLDDDVSVLKALNRLLKLAGFNVKAYSSAHEFLNCGYEKQTGLLILDMRMPEMSGIEVQKIIVDSGSKMPIVFITAHENEEIKKVAIEAGAVAFFQKPFEEDALLSSISTGCEKSH